MKSSNWRCRRTVFDLRPAACLNNDRYCRVDDIAIENAGSLYRARRHRVCTPRGHGSDAASSVAHASFWKARTSCSEDDMRSDVLVQAAAAVALVACGVAHSADLSQLSASHAVSNRTNSCIVFCGIVVIGPGKAGRHVFVSETARVVLSFLPARPNSGVYRSSRGLKRQSRPISPTAAKSGKGPMRRSRGKGRNSITVVSMGPAEPALSKRSHRLGPSDLSASV